MLIRLESIDDPQLEDYRALKSTNLTRWSNRFIAEGRVVVERLIDSNLQIHSILVAEPFLKVLAPRVPEDVPLFVLPQPLANELVGFQFHQGVLAAAERPQPPSLEKLLEQAPPRMTMVACSRVTDPVNLATIIRLCTAFGATALLLETGCADPYSRRTVRVSMGNVLKLPVLEIPDLLPQLEKLRTAFGLSLFATVLSDTAEPLDQIVPPPRSVLVFGNEAEGLSAEWRDFCDSRATIPMRGGTDSLNVAVAAGIFLYHFDPERK